MRLLLVDDDSGFRALLRMTFEDVAVDVDEAASAAEAEQRIAAAKPDVIVLDVVMPKLTGFEVCQKLREHELTRTTPILLVTTRGEGENVQKGYADGKNGARTELDQASHKMLVLPNIPEWPQLQEALDLELYQAHVKQATPRDALSTVAQAWTQTLQGAGYGAAGKPPYTPQS